MTPADAHIVFRRMIRPGRIFFSCVLLAAGLLPASALGADLRLSSGRGDTIRVKPGALLALPVTFENTGATPLTISSAIVLPDGWRIVGKIPQLTIAPASKELQLLSIMVARTAPARSHTLTVASGVTGGVGAPTELRIPVVVDVVRRIEATVAEIPRTAVAGERVHIVVDVMNRGNDTARVRFIGWNSRQYPVTITPATARLAPMSSARVSVEVETAADDKTRGAVTTELLVRPTIGTDVRSAGAFDVVPRSGSAAFRSLNVPAIVTARATAENERRALQGEVSAVGSLREDKKDKLEVLVRSPETQTRSVLGLRDEFKARYAVGDHEVYAGDWNFTLSRLTEVGRTAIGVGGQTRWKDLAAGGFVNQTRFGPPIRKQTAGWLRYDVTEDATAGVHLLHQADRGSSDVLALSLQAVPWARSSVEIEAAASSSSLGSGQALFARWNGSLPWMSYDLRTVSASPQFGGYYRDLEYTTLSLVGYATSALRLELTGNLQRRNARVDTSLGSAPRATYLQAGIGYANVVTVSFRSSGVWDTLSRSPYDRREDIVQVRGTHAMDKVVLSAYADIGSLTDHRVGSVDPVRRYSVNANVRPTQRQTYGTTVEYSHAPGAAPGGRLDRISGTLTAAYVIGQGTLASLNAFGSRLSGSVAQALTVVDASVEHNFPNLHRAKLTARRSTFTGAASELAVAAEYSVPLAVPIGTATSVGIVDGRIVNQAGAGVPDVLVTMGSMAAVSDARGRFVFADVLPGPYELSIDRGTAGLQSITSVPLPLALQVIGGERLPVTLTLLPSASIEVTLERFEHGELAPDGTAPLVLTPMDGLVRVAADLRQGNDLLRRVSDRNGRLRFGDLTPGRWTLTFDESTAEGRRLEATTIEFDVAAGAAIDTTIRLLPRRRTVRIIQEGGVLQAPASPTPPAEERFGSYLIRSTPAGAFVQVSSWGGELQATRDLNRVATKTGRPIRVERTSLPDQKIVFRVLAGPFASVEAAREFCRQLDR